jgi:spore maturation protein CgeB
LEPWVHFVPIKNDFSDLIEKIKYLNENNEKAKNIANNA